MAGWIDFFSLFVTVGIFGGVIYGIVFAVKQISESIKTTKESLKNKGYDISDKGVSIKTSKRFDRQDYIDATQRNMLKTMTAASFNRRNDSIDGSLPNSAHSSTSPYTSPIPSSSTPTFRPPAIARADSNVSAKSGESGEKRKRSIFGGTKKNSF